MKTLNLYHSTTQIILGDFKIKGNCGYGAYFARTKKDSLTFGDITYKVKIKPLNTLIFNDNEVKEKGFFNMSESIFNSYISLGYDSIAWLKNNKLKEFIVLDKNIITDKTIIN